jgi:hypothetical protein
MHVSSHKPCMLAKPIVLLLKKNNNLIKISIMSLSKLVSCHHKRPYLHDTIMTESIALDSNYTIYTSHMKACLRFRDIIV